jgi:prevent-host-death family protein
MKTMDASRVRGDFAGVLEGVRDDGRPVVIVRYGRPIAALVPLKRLSPRELRTLNHHAAPPAGASAPRPGERAAGRAR